MSVDQKSTSSNSLTGDQSSFETVRCLKKRKSFNDHIVQAAKKPRSSSHDDFYLRDDQVMIERGPFATGLGAVP
ncbi:unnamed protein product [Rhodiola kirilowii]